MLHEVLLSLSGHPSALLEAVKHQHVHDSQSQEALPSLSLPERDLLVSVARIADLHLQLDTHTKAISGSHRSVVCRAVATAIKSQHLSRFQDHVLEVERRILTRDSRSVGAYDIVPLASIVSEFEAWERRFQWLRDICTFMSPENKQHLRGSDEQPQCSSAQLINRLRKSLQTGYPDIQETANELTKVAETAWLRQLSTWVLYGRLPQDGPQDFCVQIQNSPTGSGGDFSIVPALLPKYVTSVTGSSILFIGKSLDQIRAYSHTMEEQSRSIGAAVELKLLHEHSQLLSEVKSPISAAQLSRAVSSIRLSLSRNTLQELLPLPKIVQHLRLLQEFFLLGRGEFASTLIIEADSHASIQDIQSSHHRKAPRNAAGVLPKEGELNAVLARTWSILSAMDEDGLDEDLELAQDLLRLNLPPQPQDLPVSPSEHSSDHQSNGKLFNDVLFSAPCVLTMQLPAPFDLFLSKSEVDVYTDINAYLIALRRAQLRLANLWKQTPLRRDHPHPLGPPASNLPYGQQTLRTRQERRRSRDNAMRKVWATCGAALFLVSEITSFFEGEIIQDSWQHFCRWITQSTESPSETSSSLRPASSTSNTRSSLPRFAGQELSSSFTTQASITSLPQHKSTAPHDPETISTAHRTFLATLISSLLLADAKFTSELRALVTHIDGLIAYVTRLQAIQQSLDLEADEGVVDALTDYEKEERNTLLEIDRGRKRLDGGMKGVVGRLRELDAERMGRGAGFGITSMGKAQEVDSRDGGIQYEAWRGGGLDRLLMKLDFGSVTVEDQDSSVELL